jgi:hypothetical protein
LTSSCRKYRLDRKTLDNWLVVLELSTRWQFLEMKKLAIEQLQSLNIDPVEKIAIYNQYEIDKSLLLPEYKHLCTREGQMSIEEGEKVGLLTVLAIHQARERAMQSAVARRAANEFYSPNPADVDDEELEQILKDIFNLNQDSTTGSRRAGAPDIRAPSGDTDRQGAQTQGQSNAPPIIDTPRPDASRNTNRPSRLDSVSGCLLPECVSFSRLNSPFGSTPILGGEMEQKWYVACSSLSATDTQGI